jgi:hypothetical protein
MLKTPCIDEVLSLQASGSWRSLERYGRQLSYVEHDLHGCLLRALCYNPIKNSIKDQEILAELSQFSPQAACAIGLSRNLFALAQEQIILKQREDTASILRQALSWSLNAVVASGISISEYLPDQLLHHAGQLERTLASQLDLEMASFRRILPSQLVLVLGMHRSGTSALSGLLVKSGLDGPVDLMPPTRNNPRGYFESLGVMELNEYLLSAFQHSWATSKQIPAYLWEKEIAAVDAWRLGMLKQLTIRYPKEGRAVLKDPRLCVLLPALKPWLESTLIDTVVFFSIRHPAEVAESLHAAEGMKRSTSLHLWLEHVFCAERYSRSLSRIFVQYSDLLEEPAKILDKCLCMLGIGNGKGNLNPSMINESIAFIDTELCRQRHENVCKAWIIEEESEYIYDFAVLIYQTIVNSLDDESRLHHSMNKFWLQWTALTY